MTAMTATVSPFNFGTHAVRVVMRDNQPWFVAKDVCDTLGYTHVPHAMRILDDDEKGVHLTDTLGGSQKLSVVNESGLYALVLRSRKPEARKFAKWVTSEVLPAIRKTGGYELPNLYRTNPGDKLNSYQQQQLRGLLEEFVKLLPKEKQGGFVMQGWSKLKAHFGVPYREIPCERFDEAVSLLTRHVVEYTQPKQIEAPSFKNRRWLTEFDHAGREIVMPIPMNACILTMEELPKVLSSTDTMVPSGLLADIASACTQRLANRASSLMVR